METKPNIILYLSYYDSIKNMTERQKGQLLDLLFLYQLGEDLPNVDPVVNMAFSFISADIRRNNEKYEDISEKRRAAGKKGVEAKKKASKLANEANACKENVNVNVKENETENVKDKEKENVCVTVSRTREDDDTHDTHDPQSDPTGNKPTMEQIVMENQIEGYKLNGQSLRDFYEYNDERDWKMDWRKALKRWAAKERERSKNPAKQSPAGRFNNFEARSDPEHQDMVAEVIAMQRPT